MRLPLSLIALSLLTLSCATFPKNRLPSVTGAPAAGAKKVPMTYSITSGHNLTGSRVEGGAQHNDFFRSPLVTAFEKSGRFSSVKEGKGGAVHVDVDMLNHANGPLAAVSGFISGFTLLTVPGVASDNYTLTATARTSSGRSRQYVLEDGVNTVFWLPLIVATPFATPAAVVPKVHENMYGHLLLEMEKDGLLPKASR